MLVLLPPSETKASGVEGPPLDLATLSFPALTRTRRALIADVVRIAKKQTAAFQRALQVTSRDEVLKNRELKNAPTLPAIELYTGIVYDNLAYSTLSAAGQARADESVVIASALFGLLRPQDMVPSYRLSGQTVLPGVGGLASRWRPVLEPELTGFVVDLRSGAYANLARVPHAVEVRVLRDSDGKRTVVSHDNKWTKGKLARALCQHGARSIGDVAELGRAVSDVVEVDGQQVDLVLKGLASRRSELA